MTVLQHRAHVQRIALGRRQRPGLSPLLRQRAFWSDRHRTIHPSGHSGGRSRVRAMLM